MGERKRLNFTATEEQKQRWEEYVENSKEFDSLSEFFRKASEHELERGHPLEERRDLQAEMTTEELQEVKASLKELQSEFAWVRKELYDESDLNEIAREVNMHLPTCVDDILERQHESLESKDEFVNTGTIEDLAEVVEEDRRVVEDAIKYLRNSFIEIRETTTEAGTTHYYRAE